MRKPSRGAQINHAHRIAKAIRAYYLSNIMSGSIANDYSGSSFQGTSINGLVHVGSKRGGALEFTAASTQYIALPDLGFNAQDKITLVAWVKTVSATTQRIISLSDGPNPQIFIRVLSTGEASAFARGDAAETTSINSANSVADGEEHMIAGVFNEIPGRVRLYVDGVDQGFSDHGSAFTSADLVDCTVGRYNGKVSPFSAPSQYLDGNTEDPILCDDVLYQADISQLYFDPYAMFKRPSPLRLFAPDMANILAFERHNPRGVYRGEFRGVVR